MFYTVFVPSKKTFPICIALVVFFNANLIGQLNSNLSIEVPQKGITVQLNPTNSIMFKFDPGRESLRDILELVRRDQLRPLASFAQGYNTNTYWIYTIVHNYSGVADLVLSETRGHNITVLYTAKNGSLPSEFSEQVGGVSAPKDQAIIKSPETAFKLHVPVNTSLEVLIEISSKTSINPTILIQQEDDFDEQLQIRLLGKGFFNGLIACAIVISLIIFVARPREKWIIVYLVLLSSIVLIQLYVSNLGALILWASAPQIAELIYPLACLLFNFACIETIVMFFDTPKLFPKLSKYRFVGLGLSALSGLAFWFMQAPLGSVFIVVTFLLHSLFFGLIAVLSAKKRIDGYWFFLVIWFLYLSVLGLIVLENFGVIKSSPIGVSTSQILFIPITLLVLFAHFYKSNKTEAKIMSENNILASSQQLQRQDLLKKELELKNVNSELENTEQFKEQFQRMKSIYGLISNLAHELSSPLGNSITVIGALESKMSLDKVTSESLGLINQNIQRANTILEEFKAISSSYKEMGSSEISLSSIVEKSFFDQKTLLKSHEISFNISVDTSIVLRVNPSRILKILEILIENSILHGFGPSYTKSSGFKHIIVSATKVKDLVEIRFSDTGVGMARETLESTPQVFSSRGHGLNIASSIIKAELKGDFIFDDSNQNGATFIIRMPGQ